MDQRDPERSLPGPKLGPASLRVEAAGSVRWEEPARWRQARSEGSAWLFGLGEASSRQEGSLGETTKAGCLLLGVQIFFRISPFPQTIV